MAPALVSAPAMSTRFAARGVRGANVRARALAQRIVAAAGDNGPDAVNKDAKRRQLEMTPKGDDTPEQILRVSRGTSFEGLKSARRVALDNANAPDFDGDAEQRIGKINWAFDALIEESRAVFARAVESKPDDAEARYRFGNFYQTIEKFEEAEACYRKAIELDPKHLDSCNNLAMILQGRGDEASIDEAEAYYLRCVEIDDKCVDAMFNWATLKLHCRKDPDACRVLINQIVIIEPELKDHKLVKLLRGEEDA
jgi:tetratricopeptide (TPR) repeat protein